MSLEEKFDHLIERHAELGRQMSSGDEISTDDYVRMAKEYAELTPVVEIVEALRKAQTDLADLDAMIDAEEDAEMRAMAVEERDTLALELPEIEQAMKVLLLPRDEADARNAIVEVRA